MVISCPELSSILEDSVPWFEKSNVCVDSTASTDLMIAAGEMVPGGIISGSWAIKDCEREPAESPNDMFTISCIRSTADWLGLAMIDAGEMDGAGSSGVLPKTSAFHGSTE